jgi:hypothetical protein
MVDVAGFEGGSVVIKRVGLEIEFEGKGMKGPYEER